MITFICNELDCPNKDVEYNSLGNPATAECGGCKAILAGTNERPDPVIVEEPEITADPEV
jgi:hypothetical protein